MTEDSMQDVLQNVVTANEALAAFAQLAERLTPTIKQAITVFEEFSSALWTIKETPYIPIIPPADYERLARRVAAGYNRTHPARKLSWRRLNRPPRREVERMWMEEGR